HSWSVDGQGAGAYGRFVVDANGKWTYTLNNGHPTVQALTTDGTPLSETFTVLVSDGKGGTATQVVTITIKGTDDGATITGDAAGRVVEDTTLQATGTLVV